MDTDLFGIVLGNQSYTGNDFSKYTGSPVQDMRIANGLAEIDEDGNVRGLNENQFTKATPIVDDMFINSAKIILHLLGIRLVED